MSVVATKGMAGEAEVRRLRTLYRLLAALSQASALEEVYQAAISSLLDATSADRAAILLFDDDGVIRFKASRGLSPEYQAAVTGHSPWPQGAQHAVPVVIPDVRLDESLAVYRNALDQEGIRALAFVPLVLDGLALGKFMLYYAQPHDCTTDELEIAQAIATHVALATRHKRAELNITERNQLEVASRRLAAIVESSDDAIIGKDLTGIITTWNQGAERIFGYSAAEVLGRPVSILAAPGHNEMPDILAQIKQGNRVDHYETRRRRKDGRIIDVSLTVSPVRDAAGQIVGASKIARDISALKFAEQERALLLAREQDARRTAELFNRIGLRLGAELDLEKLVQEVTDIASALVGAEFGSFYHNVAGPQNVTGEHDEAHTPSPSLGVSRDVFAGLPMPRITELFAPTFRGAGVMRCDDLTQDPRYLQSSPPELPQFPLPLRSYLAAPVVARSGEVLGGLFFGHSVPGKFTETHETIITGIAAQAAVAVDNARLFEQTQWAQNELKRSNEELRRANQDLEVFAYSASHDLHEPLRTISISAQIIERSLGDRLQGEDAIFLGNILAASTRMNALLDDLLSYTKATKYEEGATPSVDASRVLEDVLTTLRGPIQESGTTVTSGQLPFVAMHAGRLAQIFQNLISNAIKYRTKEAPRVHIAADQRDGWCIFSVVDNGIGIEPQFAEQIFGLFKRLHGRDEYPGSGIGLAICQRIVEQYGGRIWLEQSVPGGGSTFSFALPSRPE
ncbi:MAG TPA: PAS domain S-box protein [Bryobacteraceae bacterium]|nr:PAS domain S-box protein [Bryobacteraceae bacterium]